jgi:S1-C subfamily serine protease
LKKGKVVRGWLGVMIQKITPDLKEKLDLLSLKILRQDFGKKRTARSLSS